MARIRLLRRFGKRAAHSVHDYRDSEASHLVSLGYAEYVGDPAQAAGDQHVDDAVDDNADDREDGERGDGPQGDGEPAGNGPSLAELQARAKDLGLPAYGTKAQIAQRIVEAERAAD